LGVINLLSFELNYMVSIIKKPVFIFAQTYNPCLLISND